MANFAVLSVAQALPWGVSINPSHANNFSFCGAIATFCSPKIPKNISITRRTSPFICNSVGIEKVSNDHDTQRKTFKELCGNAVPEHILQRQGCENAKYFFFQHVGRFDDGQTMVGIGHLLFETSFYVSSMGVFSVLMACLDFDSHLTSYSYFDDVQHWGTSKSILIIRLKSFVEYKALKPKPS
eukprot:Gb_37107 [translate_table: standard]